jgi:hypothetical protein
VIAGLIVGYPLLWTRLHRSMHEVGGRWALHLPGYAALRAHHRHSGRNFGTVFGSLMDRICRHAHLMLKLAGERLAAAERAAVLATSPVLAGIPT